MPKIPKGNLPGAVGGNVPIANTSSEGAQAQSRATQQLGQSVQALGNQLADQWTKEDAQDYTTKAHIALNKGLAFKKKELQGQLDRDEISEEMYVESLNDFGYEQLQEQVKGSPNNLAKRDLTLRGQGVIEQSFTEAKFYAEGVKDQRFFSDADVMSDDIIDTFSHDLNLGKGIENIEAVGARFAASKRGTTAQKLKKFDEYKNNTATGYLDAALATNDVRMIGKAQKEFEDSDFLKTELTQQQRRQYAGRLKSAFKTASDGSLRELTAIANNFNSAISDSFQGVTPRLMRQYESTRAQLSAHPDKLGAREAIDKLDQAVAVKKYMSEMAPDVPSLMSELRKKASTPPETAFANRHLSTDKAKKAVVADKLNLIIKDSGAYTKQLYGDSYKEGTKEFYDVQVNDIRSPEPRFFTNATEERHVTGMKEEGAAYLHTIQNDPDNDFSDKAVTAMLRRRYNSENANNYDTKMYVASLFGNIKTKSAILDLDEKSLERFNTDVGNAALLQAKTVLESKGYYKAMGARGTDIANTIAQAVASRTLDMTAGGATTGNLTELAVDEMISPNQIVEYDNPWFSFREDTSMFLYGDPVEGKYTGRVKDFMGFMLNSDNIEESARLVGVDPEWYEDNIGQFTFSVSADGTGLELMVPSTTDDAVKRAVGRPQEVELADGTKDIDAKRNIFKFEDMDNRSTGAYYEHINFQENDEKFVPQPKKQVSNVK
jgi:hypothetical protein